MTLSFLTTRWFRISVLAGVLVALLLIGTPYLIKHLARQWLLEHGGTEVAFRDVDFNPFSGTLLLEGLDVRVDRERTLSVDAAGLDLAWLPVLRKQVKVQSVELRGSRIVVDKRDTLTIGGIRLPQETPETPPEDEAPSGWLSGIDSLTLRDFRVLYRDPKVETDLVLDHLQLSGLAQWRPEQPAHVELSGSINGADVELQGELTPLAETADYRGTLAVRDLALEGFAGLAQPQLQELAGKMSFKSDFSLQQSAGRIELAHQGSLGLADLRAAGAEMRIASRSGRWDSKVNLKQSSGELRIAHNGDLEFGQTELVSGALQLAGRSGSLSGELTLIQAPNSLRVEHSGRLELAHTKASSGAGVIDNESAQWDGSTAVELTGPERLLSVQGEGALVVMRTAADLQNPPLHFKQEQFNHDGRFSLAADDSGPAVAANGDVTLHKLSLAAEQGSFQLLALEALRVSGLQLDAVDKLAMDAVQVNELYLGPVAAGSSDGAARRASLHIVETRLSRPRYADRVLAVDSIEYDGYHSQFHRNADGQWAIVRFLDVIERLAEGAPATQNAQGQTETVPADGNDALDAAAPPLEFAIGRIAAGKGSTLGILDEAVEPQFAAEVVFNKLSIEHIDSRQPEQATRLLLDGRIDKYTELAAQGELRPFRESPDIDLQAGIKAMDLPQLSSYTRESLGLLLNSGTLDAELKLRTEAQMLDGGATLKLHQLQVKSVPGADALQSRIPVPLDTALDTLRDKNNTIRLEVPIAGDVTDPKFSISDAVSQALAKGVQKGALGYLALALQPYGTLITAAKYAGEAATRVRLNPVEFSPGESALDKSDRDYLAKVAQVLKDRPKIAITLCGVATQQDRGVLAKERQQQQQREGTGRSAQAGQTTKPVVVPESELSPLAEQRAAAVKAFLIGQHGVEASRLAGCLPQLELDDAKADPRVDLLI